MDMVKTRTQLLQEGKGFSGIGFRRGMFTTNVFTETLAAGGGYRKFYSKLDAWRNASRFVETLVKKA